MSSKTFEDRALRRRLRATRAFTRSYSAQPNDPRTRDNIGFYPGGWWAEIGDDLDDQIGDGPFSLVGQVDRRRRTVEDANRWAFLSPIARDRAAVTSTLLDNRIYRAAGWPRLSSVWIAALIERRDN